MGIKRLYVEKKPGFNGEANELAKDIKDYVGVTSVTGVRILHRYDTDKIEEGVYNQAKHTIYSEPPVDILYDETLQLAENEQAFAVMYLPGQYDQRADSLIQCLKLIDPMAEPVVQVAKVYIIEGTLTGMDIEAIKNHCINHVDSMEAPLTKPTSLELLTTPVQPVDVVENFIQMEANEIEVLWGELGLAMTVADLLHTQSYFKDIEKRNPTITEIRVLDTYWSDHCRHTTFLTQLDEVTFENDERIQPIRESYKAYLKDRQDLYQEKEADKPVCLMDLAVIAMKKCRQKGMLDDLEVSDEINACSIYVDVETETGSEPWLVMFKNETHNHPTEIEPFGGAATCLGGAIRDPLSGRAYVYQAMRVSGAADPTVDLSETMEGKLPQKKIVTESAMGYSSYGNQIGLATGLVKEIYHPGYVAKRMEIGAVIAAAPVEQVKRETSRPGDFIVLLGGRTGRDGCGGATGSSKEHTQESIETCGAEVQKGNAPTERKIQRLFRNPEAASLIRKCNDFGAGGVSVAIGELADGLIIDLDLVPKKYEGLDGTELAISESQERMAVVLDPKDVKAFMAYAEEENLEAVHVATVTEEKRLVMKHQNQTIVDMSREFVDSNGAKAFAKVHITAPDDKSYFETQEAYVQKELEEKGTLHFFLDRLQGLNSCSQQGLVERFDSTIGAGTVFMPYGGLRQKTPMDTMVAKIPVLGKETTTATIMGHGYNPYLMSWSPYHGAVYSVIESVAKIVATGGAYESVRLTFQEYFKRLNDDPSRWGEPMAALLGAYHIQDALSIAAIGGKDSMSGSFHDLDVPPTLVSFAVAPTSVEKLISNDIKASGHHLYAIVPTTDDETYLPDTDVLKRQFRWVHEEIQQGHIQSAMHIPYGGIAEGLFKMGIGNGIGVILQDSIPATSLFVPHPGGFIIETDSTYDGASCPGLIDLGITDEKAHLVIAGESIGYSVLEQAYESRLESVYPTEHMTSGNVVDTLYEAAKPYIAQHKVAKPEVFIPVFPGTNCEYDSMVAFERAGAKATTQVFRNLTTRALEESVEAMVHQIRKSQMIFIPGGFSAGDEPDGSGKFIATIFRNEKITEAVMELLYKRDGLMMGICNGFQALIKLGLVPYGDIRSASDDAPTLTYNHIGRHVSRMARTKIVSNASPWLSGVSLGDIHQVPLSHGEGRFVASESQIKELIAAGQVFSTYVNADGFASMDIQDNPNGSMYAVEGILSPDGRVLGKMGHSERRSNHTYKNIIGETNQYLFESGVGYYR